MVNSVYGTPIIGKRVTSDYREMLSIIRNIAPTLLAQNLVSVQPMTGPVGQIFTTRFTFDYRVILYRDHPFIFHTMTIIHTGIRPFMKAGDEEPNSHYRPWLEENVGEQGIDWDWRIASVSGDSLAIDFVDLEKAVLFELKWPH